MRRFASTFISKRSDTSEDGSSLSALGLVKRWNSARVRSIDSSDPPSSASTSSSTPRLASSDRAKSSGSSSSGSTNLPTPDDDTLSTRTFSAKKSWVSWIARKRSSTSQLPAEQASDVWPTQDTPVLPLDTQRNSADSEDDTSSESDDESEPCSLPPSPNTAPLGRNPFRIARAQEYLRVITSNKLIPTLSSPPLFHLPGTHHFPRSCHAPRFVHFQETLESSVYRRKLMRRLETTLNEAEQAAILQLALRPTPTKRKTRTPSENITAPNTRRITPFCPGLKRWISREPFEQRMLCWIAPDDDAENIIATPIKGTALGVPEIEFSQCLEKLAGLFLDNDPSPPSPTEELEFLLETESPTPPSSNSSNTSVTFDTRKVTYTALPSPLRMQHGPDSSQVPPSDDTAQPPPVPDPPAPKRGVRFAEDEADDNVPLAYILRRKKQRQEKERFLRAERERRAFESEKRKVEEERRQWQAERTEWEKERQTWEQEKKLMEEERKRQMYTEEVAASRTRREAVRTGRGPSRKPLLQFDEDDPIASGTRQEQYSDGVAGRRRASSPTPTAGSSTSRSQKLGSPPHSSRSSVTIRASSSSDGHRRSQPSAHSSEDGHMREGSASSNRRGSMASTDRSSSYSTWSTGNMPVDVMDMPLLPPTPPFVLQQYSRRRASANSSTTHTKRSSTFPSQGGTEGADRRQRPSSQAHFSQPPTSGPPPPAQTRSSAPPPSRRPPISSAHARWVSEGDESLHRSSMAGSAPLLPRSSSQPVPMAYYAAVQPSPYASVPYLVSQPHPWMALQAPSYPYPTAPRSSTRPHVS